MQELLRRAKGRIMLDLHRQASIGRKREAERMVVEMVLSSERLRPEWTSIDRDKNCRSTLNRLD